MVGYMIYGECLNVPILDYINQLMGIICARIASPSYQIEHFLYCLGFIVLLQSIYSHSDLQ